MLFTLKCPVMFNLKGHSYRLITEISAERRNFRLMLFESVFCGGARMRTPQGQGRSTLTKQH